tara:strand:- start:1161 stop:1934 length:774 start_codon:yes stop_codon:yes gene_type:complete
MKNLKIDDESLSMLSTLNIVKNNNYDYPNNFFSVWDDFTQHVPSWEHYLIEKFKGKDDLTFLELGTAQGRATVWLLEEILIGKNCSIYTVDDKVKQKASTKGNSMLSDLFSRIERDDMGGFPDFFKRLKDKDWWGDRENIEIEFNVINNLKPYIDKNVCNFYNCTSSTFFKSMTNLEPIFDFIYIDASHNPEDVIFDGINAFRHLKTGGIIIFDDYFWGKCRVGIDCFIETHKGYLNSHLDKFTQYQMIVEKTKDLS